MRFDFCKNIVKTFAVFTRIIRFNLRLKWPLFTHIGLLEPDETNNVKAHNPKVAGSSPAPATA
jgi:hypothetical protein